MSLLFISNCVYKNITNIQFCGFFKWVVGVLAVCFLTSNAVAVSAADEVRLYDGHHFAYKFGYQSFYGKVDVANVGYTKNVTVTYNPGDGTWYNEPATYLQSITENHEIWKWDANTGALGSGQHAELGNTTGPIQFAVRYDVNGVTYWDNNNTNNYKVRDSYGEAVLGYPSIVKEGASLYNGNFTGSVLLKNLNYMKDVKVVYSTDNWATTNNGTLAYFSSLGNSLERWNFNLGLAYGSTQVKYAFSYTVNGVTYWDNNFGSNYMVDAQ